MIYYILVYTDLTDLKPNILYPWDWDVNRMRSLNSRGKWFICCENAASSITAKKLKSPQDVERRRMILYPGLVLGWCWMDKRRIQIYTSKALQNEPEIKPLELKWTPPISALVLPCLAYLVLHCSARYFRGTFNWWDGKLFFAFSSATVGKGRFYFFKTITRFWLSWLVSWVTHQELHMSRTI